MDEDSSRSSDDDPLSSSGSLRCRINPKLWWTVLLGILEAAFLACGPFLPLGDGASPYAPLIFAVMGWPMATAFASFCVRTAFDLRRGEIRADEGGLRWRRGFSDWKSASWSEISDFYKKGTARIVETPIGKLELSSNFVGVDKLAELVAGRAVNAPVREWQRKGFSGHESWSLSLSLWSKSQKWTAPLMSAALLCVGVMFLGFDNEPHGAPQIGQWYDALALIVALLPLTGLVVAGMGMVWLLWRERHIAWQHRDETLLLNAQGLIFSSLQTRVEANWEEIQSIERVRSPNKIPRVRVHTGQGDFVIHALRDSQMWPQFRRLAGEYAPHATASLKAQEEQELLQDDLDGPRGAWSGGEVGVGARVFSFRSRGNRLVLACSTLVLAFVPFIYLIHSYALANSEAPFAPDWILFGSSYGVVALVIAFGWLWFKRSAVWADEAGLLLHFPLRAPRRILWADIETSGRDATGEWVRLKGRRTYFTLFFTPLRHAELLSLIERRGELPSDDQ